MSYKEGAIMNFVFAYLYKKFVNSPNADELAGFSLLGYYDYLDFSVISNENTLDLMDYDQLMYDAMHRNKSGYELQSICLCDCEVNDPSYQERFLSSDYVLNKECLPFIVLTMVEDHYNWNNVHVFRFNDFVGGLQNHLNEYQVQLDTFMADYNNNKPFDIVRMLAFQPLDCADAVLLFRTNSLQAVQDFIISLKQSVGIIVNHTISGVSNQISRRDLLHLVETKAASDDNLELSMQIGFTIGANNQYELARLESYLKEKVSVKHFLTSLADNHQYLFHFQSDIYRVLAETLNSKGVLNPFGENPFHLSVRKTLLQFKLEQCSDQSLFNNIDIQRNIDAHFMYGDNDMFSVLETTFFMLCKIWTGIGKEKLLRQKEYFERSKRYADSINNILAENKSLYMALQMQGKQLVKPEIQGILVQQINVLVQNINVYTCWLEYLGEKLGTDDADTLTSLVTENGLIKQHIVTLQQIYKCLKLLGTQMISMTHIHRKLLDARGLFRNEISTTKLSLGYIEYVEHISKKLLSTETDAFDTIKDKNVSPYAFFISFGNTDYKVETTQQFYFLHLLNIAQSFAYKDFHVENPHYLINISISELHIFNTRAVRFAITHECSHYFGWRDRELRAISVIKAMSKWFANVLLPTAEHCILEEVDGICNIQQNINLQIKDCIEICEKDYMDERSRQVAIVEEQLISVATIMLRSKFDGNLNNTYTYYLRAAISEIFIEIASGAIPADIYGVHFDLPILVANCIFMLRRKQIDFIKKWFSSSEREYYSQLAYQLVSMKVQSDEIMMTEIVQNLKVQINQHLHGGESTSNPYKSIALNQGVLKRNKSIIQKSVDYHNTSITEVVDTVCNVCSETYADLVAIKMLKVTEDEYIKYVWYRDDVGFQDYWRLQIIKETVYPDNRSNNIFWEMIKEGTGSYQTLTPIITEYLKQTIENNSLRKVLEEGSYFYIQQVETARKDHTDTELLYLLSCFQKLHCSYAMKPGEIKNDRKN